MATHTHDILIIGQGLAGSLLARLLLRAGQRVMVLDDQHASSSSMVAAGMINPLAGMRFNCAERMPDWLTSARQQYQAIAEQCGEQRLHEVAMQRLFRSPEQERFYQRQTERPASAPYLAGRLTPEQFDAGVKAPHGGFAQQQTGYLDMPGILGDLKSWLNTQQAISEQVIDYADIQIDSDGVRLAELRAPRLIFCEGYRVRHNPWFGDLPLQPDKGEFLHLRSADRLAEHIINGAHWLLPLRDGSYRLGATHEHQHIDNQHTPAARAQLLAGLDALLENTEQVEVIGQGAGVRPATQDRKPLIGQHPKFNGLYVFNGFGARGALTIPWHAEQMVNHLLNDQPLPAEADISRLSDWATKQTGDSA